MSKIKTYKESPKLIQEVYDAILAIPDYTDVYGADLASVLTESVWYGDCEAYDWLVGLGEQSSDELDLFDAISFVTNYEKFYFDALYTDVSYPSNVVQSFVKYATGSIVNNNTSPTLDKKWNEALSDKEMKKVLREVVTWINDNPRWWHRSALQRLV